MASDRKRKRETNADSDSHQRPLKTHVTEHGDNKSAQLNGEKKSGEHRQLKSERRKKQTRPTKQNKATPKIVAAADNDSQSTLVQDDLASGQDFVSLSSGPSAGKKASGQTSQEGGKGNGRSKAGRDSDTAKDKHTSAGQSSARFICFVGNLPYTATTEQIAAHFSKLQPKAIRLSTDKKTGKPKGFAFLEFDDYDRMKTCLKLYHHSIFDPEHADAGKQGDDAGQTSKPRGRKINVELTAGGGGGKSAGRRDRIKAKNQKLDEERARDWEKKKQEEAEKSRGSRRGKDKWQLSGANAESADAPADDGRGAIHPSRMSRVRA